MKQKAFLIKENKSFLESEPVQRIDGLVINTNMWQSQQVIIQSEKIESENTICDVYISNESLSVFEKAKIKGRCEAGKLILTCAKVPTAAIAIDVIKVVG